MEKFNNPETNNSLNFQRAERINESWKTMEGNFHENLSHVNAVNINLGVDLGTSFSKVVWRLGENAYPLCFGQNRQKLTDYLAPSTVTFGENKIICGIDAENDLPIHSTLVNFKMCLACESEKNADCGIEKCSLTKWNADFFKPHLEKNEAAFVNAFFLAKLLTQTKKLILAELKEKGFRQPISVKWKINFSVPERFIELSEISTSFQDVFKTAWLMTEMFLENPNLNDREVLFDCYLTAKELAQSLTSRLRKEGKDFDCFAYSEIGAEVASIILSKTSEEGLYAFVDVGAGTVDASVFRFWRDGSETKRPPYAAEIFKNGAAQLEIRASKNSDFSSGNLKEIKENFKNLSKTERKKYSKEIELLTFTSEEIKEEVLKTLKVIFKEAYRKEPNIDRWQDLKLVLGGGGSELSCYAEAANRAFTLEDKKNPKLPETTILPKPDDFQMFGLPETKFHRFAVAYGLSHEIINLPEIIFTKDVAPIHQTSSKIKKHGDWYEK